MDLPFEEIDNKVKEKSGEIDSIVAEIKKVIVGQDYFIRRILIALFSGGHLLVEGVPGLAKTLAIKTVGEIFDLSFKRIQFTPDLLPADLTGTVVFNPKEVSFSPKKGPIFTNLLLADEINRAPAKVQSALLEAMEERQVTLDEYTFKLPFPFMVMATQNPLEYEGTYPLPEAELDRFMMKIKITYPLRNEEIAIVKRFTEDSIPPLSKIVNAAKIEEYRSLIKEIYLDSRLREYLIDIVRATREPDKYGLSEIKPYIEFGASPRASIYLLLGAKANAFLEERGFVIPEDIKEIIYDILRHRIILTYNAEADNITTENIISNIIRKIPLP